MKPTAWQLAPSNGNPSPQNFGRTRGRFRSRSFLWRKRLQEDAGSIVLEAALSTVLLMTLLVGAIEGAQLLYSDIWIANLAREAARYAVVRGSTSGRAVSSSDITTFVQGHAGSLKTAALTATTTWTPSNAPGGVVKIKVQYTFTGYLPFVPLNTIVLQSTSQMVIWQ